MHRILFIRFYFLTAIFSLIISDINAQINSKLYYNNQWQLSLEEDANYYRDCTYDTVSSKFSGEFIDYTINNIKIGSGRYENNYKSGFYQYFDDDGILICEGEFINDIPVNIWTWYYSNGMIKQKIEFNEDDFNVVEYYDSTGNNLLDAENFIWTMDLQLNSILESMKMTGKYINQKKDGKWEIFSGNELVGYDIYKKGIYKKSYPDFESSINLKMINNKLLIPERTYLAEQFHFQDNVSQDEYPYLKFLPVWEGIAGTGIIDDSIIFSGIENPKYLGGKIKLDILIAKNLRYPNNEEASTKEGKVWVEVIIDENGVIENENVLKSPGENFSNEAVRVVKMLGNFKPALYEGKPIKSRIILTITFINMGVINIS